VAQAPERLHPLTCCRPVELTDRGRLLHNLSTPTALRADNQQQELYAQFKQQQMQHKIDKTQEQCRKKLTEVHNGYLAVGDATAHPLHCMLSTYTQMAALASSLPNMFLWFGAC
jgi:hypothetical protein